MSSNPSSPAGLIFPLVMGCLMILLAVFSRPLQRILKITPRSEAFTIPKFQRSARIVERLGLLSTAIMGVGFILYGVGGSFLSSDTLYTILFTLAGLLGLIFLAMTGVTLANWKA